MGVLADAIRVASVDVVDERWRQIKEWGEQHLVDGTGDGYWGHLARTQQQWNDFNDPAWADVLAEKFYEAIAESDPAKLRLELVQVAAVAVAWIEDIDSRKDSK